VLTLVLGAAFAADVGFVVVECMTSSSKVAVLSRDLLSFHCRNQYGMLGCDFVVCLVANSIAVAVVAAAA
jgi:hypothetical protein